MRYNVVIPITLVLVILIGGWAYLDQFNDVPPQMEEKLLTPEDELMPFPPEMIVSLGREAASSRGSYPSSMRSSTRALSPRNSSRFLVI